MAQKKKQTYRKQSNRLQQTTRGTQQRTQQQTQQRRQTQQQVQYAPISFTQLRSGDWAIRISGRHVGRYNEGDTVTVEMKDGNTKDAVLGNFIWDGEDRDGNAVELFARGTPVRHYQKQNQQRRRNNNDPDDGLENEIPF